MAKERILYTDEHDVVVTDTTLEAKKQKYRLSGIIGYWQRVIRPHRLVWAGVLVTGMVLFAMGLLGLFPYVWNVDMGDSILLINPLMIGMGLALVLVSIVVLFVVKDRYAVRIAVAQGEKNVVVSKNKAYVTQIIAAIDKAFEIQAHPEPRYVETHNEKVVEEHTSS